jgi:hypothetical protein
MNDPFLNLYHIIVDSCQNNKLNIDSFFFQGLGDNDPLKLVDKQICRNNLELEINYLLKKRIIFHDQEPIIFNDFIKNWDCKIAQINRLETNHILSNSEINSNEKDLLLKK